MLHQTENSEDQRQNFSTTFYWTEFLLLVSVIHKSNLLLFQFPVYTLFTNTIVSQVHGDVFCMWSHALYKTLSFFSHDPWVLKANKQNNPPKCHPTVSYVSENTIQLLLENRNIQEKMHRFFFNRS